jgi:hypothetical protein
MTGRQAVELMLTASNAELLRQQQHQQQS